MFNIFTRQGVVEVKTMTIFWSPLTPPRRGWQGETLKPYMHLHFHNIHLFPFLLAPSGALIAIPTYY